MAFVPSFAHVPPEKLRDYLLRPRATDDKSQFLARAGFGRSDWRLLRQAIRELAATAESTEDGKNEYGRFWRSGGRLVGPSGTVEVVLVWLEWEVDGSFHFVTLKPLRRKVQ